MRRPANGADIVARRMPPRLEITVPVPLRWRDIDSLGHLNQAVYHELLEEGRVALFDRLGDVPGATFVLARVELDYEREVRHDAGHVDVVMRVVGAGRSSIDAEHDIRLPDGTLAATGRSVLVAWDADARRSRPLSDEERARLGVA
ncbi:MAG: acyl-CoA thioesterase [Acidimicrobiales bacterium]|nr:acyl-CoA thioesterase [Acidimicrobiales bacterium]